MAIRIGAQTISTTQEVLLNEAKASPGSVDALRNLLMVVRDTDITSGKETVHPDWARIFTINASEFKAHVVPKEFAELEQIFGMAQPFDSEVLKIELTTSRLAFLLGAGASKPSPSDIPTVAELLPDLLQRGRRLNRKDLDSLAEFCERSKIGNIEDLLTAAQLSEFCSRTPTVLSLIEFLIYRKEQNDDRMRFRSGGMQTSVGDLSAVAFLQDTLQVLFGLLSSRMLPAKPNRAHRAIAHYIKRQKNVSIVTTNYDCCMDLALGAEGRDFSYLVDFANGKSSALADRSESSLIKLHGSLNWFYCDTCQEVHLIDIKKVVKEYIADENCYSVIAVCKKCGGQRRGLLVPPLAMKFDLAPPLTPLMGRAQDAFSSADVIVAVGFSFADADLYISRMVTKAFQKSSHIKMIVFDPDYGVVEKLRRQLSLRISDFDSKRVLRVACDCSQSLPAFLAGKLKGLKLKDALNPTKAKATKSPIPTKAEAAKGAMRSSRPDAKVATRKGKGNR